MSTDRALLEAAAKAAGYVVHTGRQAERDEAGYGHVGLWIPNESTGWNPLLDDGQALRLAVKLDMNVFQSARSAYAVPSDDDGTYEQQVRYSDAGGDPYAATRRAIVRAAAVMVPEETP